MAFNPSFLGALLLSLQSDFPPRETAYSHRSHPILPGHSVALRQEQHDQHRHQPIYLPRKLLLHLSQRFRQHSGRPNLRPPDPPRAIHRPEARRRHPPRRHHRRNLTCLPRRNPRPLPSTPNLYPLPRRPLRMDERLARSRAQLETHLASLHPISRHPDSATKRSRL